MKKKIKNNICCFASAFLAGVFFLFVCYHFKVFPFGDEYCLFKIDLVHQYAPILTNFYDLIKEGKNIFYSWEAGLGYSFVGNFFTYISSPLNLIVLLFRRENIPNAISVIILLKSMLTAGCFSYYLKRTFEKNDAVNVGFSLLYAFSGWFVAYNWNIMWLDALFCLPLAAVGVQNIIKEKRLVFYLIVLAYSIFSGYYTAYMLCLFLCLYFVYYYFTNTEIKKDFSKGFFKSNFFKSGTAFALSSIAAACLAAVAVIPMIFVLKKSSSVTDSFSGLELLFNPLSFWSQHFSGVFAVLQQNNEYGAPNVWCGMLFVLLLPVYFLSKGVSKKEKVSDLGIWLFMALSLGVNFLCFVWCGFHFPNGFGDRFSFIYIFVALTITFKAVSRIKDYKPIVVIVSAFSAAGFIAVMYFSGIVKVEKYTLIIGIGFSLIWLAVYFASKIKKLDISLIKIIVLFFLCVEIIFSQLENFDFNFYREDYDGGSVGMKSAFSKASEKDDELFFRSETVDIKSYISPMIVGYNGISDYSSSTDYSVAKSQCALGLSGNKENYYTYLSQTPVYNSIFAIKYLAESGSTLNKNAYLDFCVKNEKFSVYRNTYCLPLGFTVRKESAEFGSETDANPFYMQNKLFEFMSGVDGTFEFCRPEKITTENLSLNTLKGNETKEYQCYSAEITKTDEIGYVTFEYMLPRAGEYFFSCDYKTCSDGARISVSGERIQFAGRMSNISYEPKGIVPLGSIRAGETVEIRLPVNKNTEEKPISVYVASFNRDKFIEGYNKLSQHTLELTEFENTHFKGNVTAGEDCLLFTSIPYDKGWHITLDGKPVDEKDVVAIDNAYISIPLTKGEHEVEFNYFPQGLKAGAVISVTTAVCILSYCIISKKRKRGKIV